MIEKKVDKITKQEIYKTQLSCGMNAYFFPFPNSVKIKVLNVFTKFGSIDDKILKSNGKYKEIPKGTAHFLEHCCFYFGEDNKDLLTELGEKSVSSNAWTYFDHTNYHFNHTGIVKPYLTDLLRTITKPQLIQINIDKERNIINREIARDKDNNLQNILNSLRQSLFYSHPLRNSILGNEQSIAQITEETLNDIHQIFYTPSNLNLLMLGSKNKEPSLKVAKRYFNMAEEICDKLNFKKLPLPKLQSTKEPKGVKVHSLNIYKNISTPLLGIGFKSMMNCNNIKESCAYQIFIESIFSNFSKDMQKMKDKKLFIGNNLTPLVFDGRNFNSLYFLAYTHKPKELKENIMALLNKGLEKGVSSEIINLTKKESLNLILRQTEFQDIQTLNRNLVFSLANEEPIWEFNKIIKNLTTEEVIEIGKKYLDPAIHSTVTMLSKK